MSGSHPISSEIEQRIRLSFARQGLMGTIGAQLQAVRPGEVDILLPFNQALTQQHGFLHAGIVTTIADNACGFAALSMMPDDAAVLTTEFKVNFMSPAKGDHLRAIGRVVRAGRKLIVCLADVFAYEGANEKHIALMTASMMVVTAADNLRD